MDIRQLTAFLSACEHGSISKAAAQNFVSPQALSRTIASLEKDVGLELFIRTPQGLVPTEAGLTLRELSIPVINAMNMIHEQMGQIHKEKNQKLSIGITSAMEYFLQETDFDVFSSRYPECSVSLDEYSHSACQEMVSKGLLTTALIHGPINVPGIDVVYEFTRQRVCVVAKDHPLAKRELIHVEDLRWHKLVATINKYCYENFVSLCHKQGFSPDFRRVNDSATVFQMCTKQGFADINLDFVVEKSVFGGNSLVALPIDKEEFSYPVYLIANSSENKRNAKALINYAKAIIQERNKNTLQYPFNFC